MAVEICMLRWRMAQKRQKDSSRQVTPQIGWQVAVRPSYPRRESTSCDWGLDHWENSLVWSCFGEDCSASDLRRKWIFQRYSAVPWFPQGRRAQWRVRDEGYQTWRGWSLLRACLLPNEEGAAEEVRFFIHDSKSKTNYGNSGTTRTAVFGSESFTTTHVGTAADGSSVCAALKRETLPHCPKIHSLNPRGFH